MIHTSKITATILFIFLLLKVRGQYGQFEITIMLNDKADHKIINDSLLSSIEKGYSVTFDTLDFYVPMEQSERIARIKTHNLHKKQLTGFNVAFIWDPRKNEAVMTGYAPLYAAMKTYPFYVSGSFNHIFNKHHDELIRQKVKRALYKAASTSGLSPTDSTNFREIPFKQFECIYHMPFDHLPSLLFSAFANYQLLFYDDPEMLGDTQRTEDSQEQFKNAKAIVLQEQWSDTLIVHQMPQSNPLPFDTYYLRKKIKAIGLVLPNGQMVWADYDRFKKALLYNAGEAGTARLAVYELYFQSDFCRQLKMDMYIK